VFRRPRHAIAQTLNHYERSNLPLAELEPKAARRPDGQAQTKEEGSVKPQHYEISFNRHFYPSTPPRPLEAVDADLKQSEERFMHLLKEVTA